MNGKGDPAGADADLGAAGEAEWARLRRQLELAEGFWLACIFASSPAAATTLRRRAEHVLALRAGKLVTFSPEGPEELRGVLAALFQRASADAACLWVQAVVEDAGPWREAWDDVFLRLNERRDALRRHLTGGLVLAAPASAKARARNAAPDLWSIRSLVIEVSGVPNRRADRDGAREPLARTESAGVATNAALPLSGSEASQRAKTLLDQVAVQLGAGDTGAAVAAGRAAVDLVRRSGDNSDLAAALTVLSRAEEAHGGDDAAAADHTSEALGRRQGSDDSLTAELLHRAGRLALAREDLGSARDAFEELVASLRRRLKASDETAEALRAISEALDWLGTTRQRLADVAAAADAFGEEVELDRRAMLTYGESPERLRDLSVRLERVGNVRMEEGDGAGAVAAYGEARDLLGKALARYGENARRLNDLAVVQSRLDEATGAAGLENELAELDQPDKPRLA